MNSWENRFSMLLLKGAAATSLRSSSRSARGLWDALSPAGAGRREWAEPREPPVLGGLRAAGAHSPLRPPRALLNRTVPQFLAVHTVYGRIKGAERGVRVSARTAGRPRPPPREPGLPPTRDPQDRRQHRPLTLPQSLSLAACLGRL